MPVLLRHSLSFFSFALFVLALFTGQARATALTGHPAFPPRLAAVELDGRRLHVLQYTDKLALAHTFALAERDERSAGGRAPEGVYFVHSIPPGMPGAAPGYVLNYPNPADLARGAAQARLVLQEGPDGMDGPELPGLAAGDAARLLPFLTPGAPVLLTDELSYEENSRIPAGAAALTQRVRDWAEAWSRRGPEFFAFYDARAYADSTEPFAEFQARLERDFTAHAWIRNELGEIFALPGPDYWVTWFNHDQSDPDAAGSGVRRLYWMRDDQGVYRIVGMEWLPGLRQSPAPDMARPALALAAEAAPVAAPSSTASGPDTSDSDASGPDASGPDASGPDASGLAAPGPDLPDQDAPGPDTLGPDGSDQDVPGPAVSAPSGRDHAPRPEESADPPGPAEPPKALDAAMLARIAHLVPRGVTPYDHVENPRQGVMARPDPRAFLLAERLGLKANPGKGGSPSGPAGDGPTHAPLQTDRDMAAQASRQAPHQTPYKESPVEELVYPVPPIFADADDAGTSQPSATAQPPAQPPAPPPAQAPASPPAQAPTRPPAARPENEVDQVLARIEDWRRVWEKGDVDAYMAFYAENAVQGSRRGAKVIRYHKERVWPSSPPARVALENINVKKHGKALVAEMKQGYADASGHQDYGVKTLTFELVNGVWLITREEWRAPAK